MYYAGQSNNIDKTGIQFSTSLKGTVVMLFSIISETVLIREK